MSEKKAISIGMRLHAMVEAVCPIYGVSENGIDFDDSATEAQKAAALSVLSSFDWSDVAHNQWLENQKPERRDLRQAASQAIADIDTYLAINSPSNAQVAAQVRRLSQYTKVLIKRLVQID